MVMMADEEDEDFQFYRIVDKYYYILVEVCHDLFVMVFTNWYILMEGQLLSWIFQKMEDEKVFPANKYWHPNSV